MEDALTQFKAWYFSKPIATRTFVSICTAMTLLITFRILPIQYIYYTFQLTFFQFNLWRPFTAFFYMGKFDFGFIFNLYFAFTAFNKVQTQIFSRQKYPDFLWLLILLAIGCIILGSIINLFFFTETFLMGLIYVWCKRLPHEQIRIMFGLVVKTGYFPFVYAIMMTLFGGNFINYIIGIALGHCYIFVKDIAIVKYHKDYLPTPQWLSRWWFGRFQEVPNVERARANFFGGRGVRLD